jgi:hypothetical protein
MYYPLESRINTLVTIRRERLLPRAGELTVGLGEAVAAEDVIGRAAVHSRWHYVDVAALLRVPPAAVESALLKKPGERVEQGETLASAQGRLKLFRRTCKAPASGTIAALHAGHLLIEEAGENVEVRAMLRGRVVQAIAGHGVVIETRGALIKAAWGHGPSNYGVLRLLADAPDQPLQMEHIDIRSHGAVLVVGRCDDAEVLLQANQMQARGLIVGSLSAGLLPSLQQLSFSIMVIDGFGQMPMNSAAFKLLREHDGQEVGLIMPEKHNGYAQAEIIIPATAETAPALAAPPELAAGQTVRLIGYPRLGAVGRIVHICSAPHRVESGEMLEGVEVELENGEQVFAPWMNIEPVA